MDTNFNSLFLKFYKKTIVQSIPCNYINHFLIIYSIVYKSIHHSFFLKPFSNNHNPLKIPNLQSLKITFRPPIFPEKIKIKKMNFSPNIFTNSQKQIFLKINTKKYNF